MKKIIIAVLVLVMMFGIVGCGSSAKESEGQQIVITTGPKVDKSSDLKIDLEAPVLLYEDENVRIELIYFYQHTVNDLTYNEVRCNRGIGLKYYNPGNYDWSYTTSQIYIGENAVVWLGAGGGNRGPDPGKTREDRAEFYYDNFDRTEIESIEDLLNLEFKYMINCSENYKGLFSYEVKIDFNELLNDATKDYVRKQLNAQ